MERKIAHQNCSSYKKHCKILEKMTNIYWPVYKNLELEVDKLTKVSDLLIT